MNVLLIFKDTSTKCLYDIMIEFTNQWKLILYDVEGKFYLQVGIVFYKSMCKNYFFLIKCT